ncbi:PilW family protein [Corallococcus sp. M34]|uniref:prepilin-type N-terminal cleavage/methylation domain-containing protein n=1 Tax=Citreicoccus inhibens TaxID=2849499 RepID=UPI001C23B9FA|nr:prepilin-type N-terminal cleavage/methylation domain-containing protein [Citreicoccus inhibens]MBU8894408.1 PilW family protein [Citreicoccus inhibens]
MRRASRRTGFTLVEILVGITVSSLVLLAVAATVIAVNNTFNGHSVSKQAVENGRVAMDYVERTVRLAGYGLDPSLAFDFTTATIPGSTKDNYSETLAGPSAWGTFITDDLAFRYRDPAYLRRGRLGGGGPPFTLTLDAATHFDESLRAGQALMLACPGGAMNFLGRLDADVAATANTATLTAAIAGQAPPACLGAAGGDAPFVMLVHERRLRVLPFGGRPYLVVQHGWQADADSDPLAVDVENFQVSYIMNRPPSDSTCCAAQAPSDGNGNWVFGDTTGADALPRPGDAAPTYDTPYDSATRFNGNPANIRAVRVGITVRSSRLMPTRALSAARLLGNSPAPGAPDAYFRTTLESSVRVPNMTSRAFFIPALRNPDNPQDQKNLWGG